MRRWLTIAVVLLVAGAAALVASRPSRTTDQSLTNDELAVNRSQIPEPASNITTEPEPTTNQLLATARLFAERFGTTASDTPAAHLEAVLSVSSSPLAQSFQRQINQPPSPTGTPTRITSRALTFVVRSFDEQAGRADVLVTLQRQEQIGSEPAKTYHQELSLQFVRQSGAWKVNVATWGKLS